MYFIDKIKHDLAKELEIGEDNFVYPPQSNLGDLSLPCFDLAKIKKVQAIDLANEFKKKLDNSKLSKYFSEIKVTGPYLNFYFNSTSLALEGLKEILELKRKYGDNEEGKKRKVIIEYSNANTHKEYHVGHLRNLSYGEAVTKLLHHNGYHSIPVSYINDFGIHTAKTIWNWKKNNKYQIAQEDRGYLLGQCYSEASKLIEDNEEYKKQVSETMKAIESRKGEVYELWKKTRQWSINYFASIYKDLGVKFDHIFYESEVINEGLNIVDQLLEKKILEKSQGAIIANLEKDHLGVLPIIRSDGTALYPVADLALAQEKFNKYKAEESIYVVDVRQSLYFKQLFRILELSGYKQKFNHFSYDFVTLSEGMMSSRSGNVITYKELKEELLKKLIASTKKRHTDWTNSRIEQVAFRMMTSVIKFEMLKVGANKIITFDINKASKFEGQTACYLQYTYARLKSIIRKQKLTLFDKKIDFSLLTHAKEKSIILKLIKYPEIIKMAGEKYDPSELSKYLFELAQLSNDYYHEVNILQAEGNLRKARIQLIKAIAQVLENGFNILGISKIEEM